MTEIRKILSFVKPYWKLATIAMIMLMIMVASDLSIPRLIERIIERVRLKAEREKLPNRRKGYTQSFRGFLH